MTAVLANAVSVAAFAWLAFLCFAAMPRARTYAFPHLFLALVAVAMAVVCASNMFERVTFFTIVDRYEEYVEVLILPLILLFSYSWAAATHAARNEEYIALLHHRVKNDLQVADSLIELQATAETGAAAVALRSARARIAILGIAERMSMERGSPRPLDMDEFLEEIAGHTAGALEGLAVPVVLRSGEPVRLESYAAIPCGLLVAELTLACAGADAPRVSLERTAEGLYRLTFSGCPRPSGGFPSDLVEAMLAQLHARLVPGEAFVAEFPPVARPAVP